MSLPRFKTRYILYGAQRHQRIFGRIEKEVKRNAVIVDPEEYTEIFSHYGTAIPLSGKNYDWKQTFEKTVRPTGQWHFQFNPSKRFHLKKSVSRNDIVVRGEVNYNTDSGSYRSITKKNVMFGDIDMPNIIQPSSVVLKELKVRDVERLLGKHSGEDWKTLETLRYYKNIIEGPVDENGDNVDDVGCEHGENEEVLLSV
uniref:Uncharacterized protein n=1 Tax=Clastoptera arizonana TaxID=38151 RepID=A0A1B6DYJ6_9HEMI